MTATIPTILDPAATVAGALAASIPDTWTFRRTATNALVIGTPVDTPVEARRMVTVSPAPSGQIRVSGHISWTPILCALLDPGNVGHVDQVADRLRVLGVLPTLDAAIGEGR